MKNKQIVSVFLIAAMVISSAALITACGSKDKQPKTLEDYMNENEDALSDLNELKKTMQSDKADGDIKIADNTVTVTMKLKDTYESDYLETMKSVFEEAIDSQVESIRSQVQDLEEKSEIEGISMVLICQNGDGTELVNKTITA